MLKTKLKNIEFNTPFINASGCWCYSQKELIELNNKKYCNDALISKSCTSLIRDGNPEHRYKDMTKVLIQWVYQIMELIIILTTYHNLIININSLV